MQLVSKGTLCFPHFPTSAALHGGKKTAPQRLLILSESHARLDAIVLGADHSARARSETHEFRPWKKEHVSYKN